MIKVVGAVIRNGNGEILCALRSNKMSMPCLWEFPGGKIEDGESPASCLKREIREELGCEIAVFDMVEDTVHDYGHVVINLKTYYASIVSGTPVPHEHAQLLWLPVSYLSSLQWAPADIPAVEKISSPVK